MPNFETAYLGLSLKNPIVASASPLSDSITSMQRLEEAGAAAIVMSSLFQEQIENEGKALLHYLTDAAESYSESTSYFPEIPNFDIGPKRHLELLRQAKQKLSIPVIASLNGSSPGGWVEWARLAQDAGADALELNEYYLPSDPDLSGLEVEKRYEELVALVKEKVTVPVSVKLNPFFSSTGNVCKKLVGAGADGLVLFNRFYQPDVNIESLEVSPELVLSSQNEIRLPLRWIGILYGRIKTDFAITSGVQSASDVLKSVMVGASVTMIASELLRHGYKRIGEILHEMKDWMEAHEYASLTQMRGSMSQAHVENPGSFERANYMKVLHSWHPPGGVL